MGGMDMGVPCCITAELGGEEPPGGKKTWAMPPEGMQGLALAIQRAVCRQSERTRSQKHAAVDPTVTQVATAPLSQGSRVPPFPESTPFQWGWGQRGGLIR